MVQRSATSMVSTWCDVDDADGRPGAPPVCIDFGMPRPTDGLCGGSRRRPDNRRCGVPVARAFRPLPWAVPFGTVPPLAVEAPACPAPRLFPSRPGHCGITIEITLDGLKIRSAAGPRRRRCAPRQKCRHAGVDRRLGLRDIRRAPQIPPPASRQPPGRDRGGGPLLPQVSSACGVAPPPGISPIARCAAPRRS